LRESHSGGSSVCPPLNHPGHPASRARDRTTNSNLQNKDFCQPLRIGCTRPLHSWLLNFCWRYSSASAGRASFRGVKNLRPQFSHIARTAVLPECRRITKRRSAIAFYRVSRSRALRSFGRGRDSLQPHSSGIAFLVNGLSVLIRFGSFKLNRFIADAAFW
jgi:hypothetical protein